MTVNSCFQCFLQALSGNNLFCNKSSGQIFLCHVTDVKYYNSFTVDCITTLLFFDYPEFQEFLFFKNTLRSRKLCWCEVSWYKSKLAREYPPELWREPGLTESTAFAKVKRSCSKQDCFKMLFCNCSRALNIMILKTSYF